MVTTMPDFAASEGCEMMCRRIYGLKRAFKEVKCQADWKQPKGNPGAKWRSKVRWDLAAEIDWRSLQEDEEEIPEIEQEMHVRLRDKALIAKSLASQLGGAEDDEA